MTITWPDSVDNSMPKAELEQTLAVKLADGSIRTLEKMDTLYIPLDFAKEGSDPIPLIDPETAQPLGMNTTLNDTMLDVLATIRKYQIIAQG